MELSPRAYKEAAKLKARLQRPGAASCIVLPHKKMQQSAALQELRRWLQDQSLDPGSAVGGSWRVDLAMIRGLEQALAELQMRGIDETPAPSRIGRVRQGRQEDKTLGAGPQANRLLVSQPVPFRLDFLRFEPGYLVWDLAVHQLDLLYHDCLLVVENLDVFYACGDIWLPPSALGQGLIVYRGHDARARAVRQLQQCWPDHKPQIYFGDLDPQGLNIALDAGYTHVLVPEWAHFAAQAHSVHNPARQIASQEKLAARTRHWPDHMPLKAYVEVLLQGRGLLQQAMLSCRLQTVALEA